MNESGFINKISYYSLRPKVEEQSRKVSLSDEEASEMICNEHNTYYDSPSNKRKYEHQTRNPLEIGEYWSMETKTIKKPLNGFQKPKL